MIILSISYACAAAPAHIASSVAVRFRCKAMAAAGSTADPGVAKSASVAQPVSFPLRELNQRSGNFGSWAVVVHQAKVIGERW